MEVDDNEVWALTANRGQTLPIHTQDVPSVEGPPKTEEDGRGTKTDVHR